MYGNTAAAAGVAGTVAGTLPMTGFGIIWFVLGACALLMAAGALWRISPRRK